MPVGVITGTERPPESTLPSRSCIIGLVEDNTSLRQALVLALETLGHIRFPAADGAELLANLGEQAPDLIISDYRLAKNETGFDVIAAARAAFGSRLPAILITGDTAPELIRQMDRAGVMVQYKPLQIDDLALSILKATASKE
jgi:CheY-like chemotaxis protein